MVWWILGAWVVASVLFTAGVALGSALGYRRGWEAYRDSTLEGAETDEVLALVSARSTAPPDPSPTLPVPPPPVTPGPADDGPPA